MVGVGKGDGCGGKEDGDEVNCVKPRCVVESWVS